MTSAYELLMAQIAQNRAQYGRPIVRPQSALGQFGSQFLNGMGFGSEAIQEMDPNSWAGRFGNFIGLDRAGVNNLESNIVGMSLPDVGNALIGLRDYSQELQTRAIQEMDPNSWAGRLGNFIGLDQAGVNNLKSNIARMSAPDIGNALIGLRDYSQELQTRANNALAPITSDLMQRSKEVNAALSGSQIAQTFMSLSPFAPLPQGTSLLEAMNAGTPWEALINEDRNAPMVKPPPSLEAILREANNGQPRNDSPNDTQSFSLGSLPPESMFHVDPTGMVGNVDYSRFAEMLPGAKRVQREVQPPTDFSAAEAAMQAAKPTYEEGNKWGQILQGLARGGLSARNGDFSEILFSAALGALGGLGSGMDIEQERKDLAKGREQQFNERLAGFDLEKAGTQRSEKQQAADAAYEADVNFNQADAARQQNIVSILMHGADQNQENTRHNASIAANTANMNRDLALKRYAMEQPNIDVNQYGLVVTKTGPNGERTMTIDNSPWVQRLQMQAMYRQMGAMGAAPGADFPGMGFTNDKEIDTQELTRRLSTYYFMSPMAAAQDLNSGEGGDIMNQMAMQTRQMLGGSQDSKIFPQMMANNLYSYLAPIIADPQHPLHGAVLKRMAEMQGMF